MPSVDVKISQDIFLQSVNFPYVQSLWRIACIIDIILLQIAGLMSLGETMKCFYKADFLPADQTERISVLIGVLSAYTVSTIKTNGNVLDAWHVNMNIHINLL